MKQNFISKIRKFNRFYTNFIGLLNRQLSETDFSLSEARVLFELNSMHPCTAKDLLEKLKMDRGYLSRILKKFEKARLVERVDLEDRRSQKLSLTKKGDVAFKHLNHSTEQQLEFLISSLSVKDKKDLIYHMEKIQSILDSSKPTPNEITH
jgi:DNA-binding MarR family transcriptional regulator